MFRAVLPFAVIIAIASTSAHAAKSSIAHLAKSETTIEIENVGNIARTDRENIQFVVHSYLWALINNQPELLYLTTAENLKKVYRSPDILMKRMAKVHRPVIGGSLTRFDGFSISEGQIQQGVYIQDERGRQWLASYFLKKDANGDWKIVGCLILPAPGQLI